MKSFVFKITAHRSLTAVAGSKLEALEAVDLTTPLLPSSSLLFSPTPTGWA
jgi:hypothetical protein